MKKILFLALAVLTLTACQQTATDTDNAASEQKDSLTQASSPAITAIRTAYTLANYGYQNQSASALIEAANILASTPSVELEVADYKPGAKADSIQSEKPTRTPEQLLKDAKAMAGNDATLVAWIAKVEGKLNASAGATRGATCGAGCVHMTYERVQAHATDVYQVNITKSELAEVAVVGDGDTDLDLYIYDENGNLIDSDTDYTDRCYCSWTPAYTGLYHIKIVNRGSTDNIYVLQIE